MERAAKLHFAFDINNLAAAEPHPRRYAARHAEDKIPEHGDREAVDLPDRLAIGFDADRPAADLFLQAAIDAVAAAELRVDGGLHLGLADHLFVGISGE